VAAIASPRPIRVTVISTGNELRPAGAALAPGMVHDVNGPMLMGLFAHPQTQLSNGGLCLDDVDALAQSLGEAARESDLIVCSGGTAGSETDIVPAAVRRAGGSAAGARLALKPGRPIVSGTIGNAVFLGIPGNPFAAFVSAQLFAWPVILALAGARAGVRHGTTASLARGLLRTPGRTEFRPARIVPGPSGELLVHAEEASGLGALARADGLVELDGAAASIPAGSRVRFYPSCDLRPGPIAGTG
jgi:molybdopterin molybdotransferase